METTKRKSKTDSVIKPDVKKKTKNIREKSPSKSKSKEKDTIDINIDKKITRPKEKLKSTVSSGWEKIETMLVKDFNSVDSNKILGFDFDDTIVTPKSGKKFAEGRNDWKFAFKKESILRKIKNFMDDGFKIIFFTNQNGITKGKTNEADWKGKVEDVIDELGIPVLVVAALESDYYRKPSIGMWDFIEEKYNKGNPLDKKNSIYVGDAAGRPKNSTGKKDFTDTDLKFALNLGIQFNIPEEFFEGIKQKYDTSFEWEPRKIYKSSTVKDIGVDITTPTTPEMIIFFGSPASGKSTFYADYLKEKGYVHINQDTLKNAAKCLSASESALKEGKSVVIDNTNPTKEKRKTFIDVAKKFNAPVRLFNFMKTKDSVFHLNNLRKINKARKHHSKHVPDMIIHKWFKDKEEPSLTEGFKEIKTINFVPGPFKNNLDEQIFYLLVAD